MRICGEGVFEFFRERLVIDGDFLGWLGETAIDVVEKFVVELDEVATQVFLRASREPETLMRLVR